MPMVFSEVHNNGHKHWEGFRLVGFEDIQKVVVLEEAHGSVSDLQVDSAYAFDYSSEQFWYQGLYFFYLADFKHFLQFRQEKCLFHTVSKWPVL